MSARPTVNRRATNVRQRKKQQHLLDVKVRASTERRRRVGRICSLTFRVLLFSSLSAGAWIGGKEALRRFVWENPDYAVHEIKIITDGALTRDQILHVSALQEGQNIFLLNLNKARAEIEKLPQVESVEVSRALPNRLSINVTERRPVAWLAGSADEDPTSSDTALLIDAGGMLMKPKVKLEEYLHFPVISGLQTANLVAGERLTDLEVQSALELIKLTSDSPTFQARHVDISKGYCLIVTDHRHTRITFGLDRIESQLERLHRCLSQAAADRREIQTVNLIVERNTPVTFVDPAGEGAPVTEAAPPPKAADPKARPALGPVKSSTPPPIPRAEVVAPPAGAAATRTKFGFKPKGATPAPAAAEPPKKQPFHLH